MSDAATRFLRMARLLGGPTQAPSVSVEMASDFRKVIGGLSDAQFARFLQNTIKANGASKLELLKSAYIDDAGSPQYEYTLKVT